MIDAAASSGANAVKFQKRDLETLYTRAYAEAPYNSENAFGATYGEHRRALEFDRLDYGRLKLKAEKVGVDLFATAFDEPSVDFCQEMGFSYIKIASAD